MRRPTPLIACCLALVVLAPAAATAGSGSTEFGYQRPGITTLVSVGVDGGRGDHQSHMAQISADGRYVVFRSRASNLVDRETALEEIYRRDLLTGQTEVVSVAADGGRGNSWSSAPAISADGQTVAFISMASDLDPADDAAKSYSSFQVYVRDMELGETQRLSSGPDGGPTQLGSHAPSVSGDGSRVAFYNGVSEGGGPTKWDVYVHDLRTGEQERASVAHDGGEANGVSRYPHLNHDGRYLAFSSTATNLVASPAVSAGFGERWHVYVRDLQTGVNELVSVNSDGVAGNHDSFSSGVGLSADGRYVAFSSTAYNLVPEDTNAATELELGARPQPIIFGRDIFVRDREAGTTERVSVRSSGAELKSLSGAHPSGGPSISADGRYVAFSGARADSFERDIYVHDRATGATELVSVALDGGPSDGGVSGPALSADGQSVAFQAIDATDLVGGTRESWDVVVRRRGAGLGVHALAADRDDDRVQVGGMASFSGVTLADAASTPTAVGPTLRRASVLFRPEEGDLLARLELNSLPAVYPDQGWVERVPETLVADRFAASQSRAVGGTYGLGFTVDGTRYELRAERAEDVVQDADMQARFSLHRCEPDCELVTALAGGYGTAGHEVRIALPLDVLGLTSGSSLTGIVAFAGDGEPPTGEAVSSVRLALGDAELPELRIHLALAGADEPPVAFDTTASPSRGLFTAELPEPAEDGMRLWAQACIGEECGLPAAADVRVDGAGVSS